MLFQSGIWSGYMGNVGARRLWTACFALFFAASALPAAAEGSTNWTVLTVARNGNWGIASARTQGEAIAGAVFRCQAMTADESDCGAELVVFKSGLATALLCGDHRVIVTANDPAEADGFARPTCPSEGTLWSELPFMPASAADRIRWRSHYLQSETASPSSFCGISRSSQD